jgi:putative tryptophan/tyrosine transport system substrate-binding protein
MRTLSAQSLPRTTGRRAPVRALLTLVVGILAPSLLFGDTIDVAIVTSREIAPYRAAYEGFKEVMDEAGIRYRTTEYRTETEGRRRSEVVQKLRSHRPDLILTIGSAATQAVASEVRDIPIIFSLVLDGPALRKLGENVTGASMAIPLEVQFEKLHEAMPKARKFGVLFNPEKSGALVAEAGAVVEAMGLELVALPVTTDAEILAAVEQLEGKVDLLWSVADPTILTPPIVRFILLNTLRHKIPFIGLSPSYVRAGALLSFSCDYQDVGRQAAEQALQVLRGNAPDQLPITFPRSVSTHLNLNTADKLEIEISDPIREMATVVSGS